MALALVLTGRCGIRIVVAEGRSTSGGSLAQCPIASLSLVMRDYLGHLPGAAAVAGRSSLGSHQEASAPAIFHSEYMSFGVIEGDTGNLF